jgi:hypothetical protein
MPWTDCYPLGTNPRIWACAVPGADDTPPFVPKQSSPSVWIGG